MNRLMENKFYFGCAVLLVTSLSVVSCDREERTQGGKLVVTASQSDKGTSANPTPTLNYANVPAVSHVAEFDQAGGGVINAQALYAANCSACHQATGLGVPGAFPPLDGSEYVISDNLERLASIMLYGLTGPIKVKGQTFNSVMLPLGGTLKDEELAAIASYIRTSWSNKASAVEPTVFAKMREKWGTRPQFTIQELGEE